MNNILIGSQCLKLKILKLIIFLQNYKISKEFILVQNFYNKMTKCISNKYIKTNRNLI